jgi:hypothetical protein
MKEAYDVTELVKRVAGRGLDLGETAVEVLIEEVFGWTEDSVRLSATPFDDIALVVLPKLKALAMEAADKIDGKVHAVET